MLADIPVTDQPDRGAMTAGPETGPIDELAEGKGLGQTEGGLEDDLVGIRVPAAPRAVDIPGASPIGRVKGKPRQNRQAIRDGPGRLLRDAVDFGQVGRALRLLIILDRDEDFFAVTKQNVYVDARVGRVAGFVDEIDPGQLNRAGFAGG